MKRQRPSNSPRQALSNQQSSSKKTKKAASPNSPTTPNEKNNRNWKQWKQQQIHDYNTHQFLDSSATVHAGLFGARRLPEIKSLWRHVVQNEVVKLEHNKQPDQTTTRKVGESGGGKISSRHLRRRTGVESNNIDDGMDVESDIPLASDQQLQQQKGKDIPQMKQKCRRARRKPALLKQLHSYWWKHQQRLQTTGKVEDQNPAKTSHNWIPTHLWHAKRFHMSSPPIFSWTVPLLHANRGSRASLRLATSQTTPKCTIQDATWEIDGCAIVLRASQINSSSSPGEQAIEVLQSMMGRVTDIKLSDNSITSGHLSVEGLIHAIDSFPASLVGPGTFMFTPINDAPSSEACLLSIFVHPAIRLKVMTILTTLVENHHSDSDINLTISTEPYSLLRVRGTSSTATVADVLSFNWMDILPHDVNVNEVDHGTLLNRNEKVASSTDCTQSSNQVILKSHQPNRHHSHLPQNVACSGWDILCHPSIGNDLFQMLVRKGGSCAIGVAEDAWAQLEASPPLPIFPRDYPDSAEGQSYWEGSSTIGRSWGRNNKLLRQSQREGCDEKVSIEEPETLELVTTADVSSRKTLRIHWSCLVSPKSDQSVIVVRGSFGVPFLQLLHGCGRLPSKTKTSSASSNVAVHAPPLSKCEKEGHSKLCQQLKASLSLPALLRCEIFFEGKGSPSVGDFIYSFTSKDDTSNDDSPMSSDKESLLGLVVAGSFSPTRGRSYGVAFVSAAMFIDALDGTEHGMVKEEQMFLEVAIAKGPSSPRHLRRCALLSLLL
ncbi:ribonucleases P/MRP protein subunit Pop1 [Skeletonema marinoi]|uniref:Ribonucleases P/MRP protein subunit Pop1 n=1 Tax=Skeletonema marinoi TaxID=267567 RepID=A0AAD8YGG9_9STRA|nr:ribonucleases P/MRP protein subunit Pop1 [Skeletonema marinoi]